MIDYEVEYNNRARVPEHPEIFARWRHDAAAYRERMQAEHEAILGALAERDGERAERLVQDHLRHGSEHIATLLATDATRQPGSTGGAGEA